MTKAIPRRSARETLPFGARKWLLTGERTFWLFFDNKEDPEVVWERHAEVVTAYYARKFPGLRPCLWWRFNSPEPRRRLGGTGKLLQETCPAIQLRHEFGLPADWGALSETDPPAFEAEATYLRRLDLLLPGELERLGPKAFEPRVVLRIGDRFRVQRMSSPRHRGASNLEQFLARAH
jgi:hypothetical protein